ncbi:hypothetical protein RV10_GL004488 [Enterococcus pallens]|nr:hypothetical protein RV10_GL004488 [Enterococcus pallens]
MEFVDSKGNDFPVPITLTTGDYFATEYRSGGYWTGNHSYKVSISPVVGKNASFDVKRTASSMASVFDSLSYEYLRDMAITADSSIPYVKYFSVDAPPGQELKDQISNVNSNFLGAWSRPTISKGPIRDRKFEKQTATRFYLPNTTNVRPGYSGIRLGYRYIGESSSGSGGASWVGHDGDVIRYYAYYFQIIELYEDQNGNSIPAPPGYTDGKTTDITSETFRYDMENGQSLPRSYTDATHAYTFEGWYRGSGNQAAIDRTYPPSIGFDAIMDDVSNEVHIVYKKIPLDQVVQLKEKFIDESGAQIEAAWDQTSSVEKDVPITVTPATPKTDTSGADWEYLGWKWDTDPTGTVNQTPINLPMAADTEIHYIYKKIQHTTTEKWVDVDDGTTLIDLTPNPKTSQINSNETFTSNPAATITDREGNEWEYIGWENVSDDPGNVQNQSTVSIPNLKADKEIKYHYKRLATTAALELNSDKQIVDNGGNVSWTARLTNTGTIALKNIVLKAAGNYSNGLSTPGQLTVTPAGKGSQTFPVGATWKTTGIDLSGITIPSGGTNNYADIKFTTTATGNANQVLMAELDAAGNLTNSIQANNVVRIDDADQPNLKPTGDVGFINLPDFRFGYTRLEPHNHYKGLEKSLYEPNYNPYVRLMNNTTPDRWEVFVQLDQFKSNIHTLPKTTSLTLINGALKQVQNYNHPSETLTSAGSIADQTIYSDSSSVRLMGALTQGVYQADYDFDDVQLNLIGKSGLRNRYYTSTMHWKLVTGP